MPILHTDMSICRRMMRPVQHVCSSSCEAIPRQSPALTQLVAAFCSKSAKHANDRHQQHSPLRCTQSMHSTGRAGAALATLTAQVVAVDRQKLFYRHILQAAFQAVGVLTNTILSGHCIRQHHASSQETA
eukprot:GHRR01000700.1.p1 GENE.GHRR01000700.1~~GHRR01000700.1.p1  ORF type:complete len:130 (-),score=37.86 GHRR01000700.1:464-853(-)